MEKFKAHLWEYLGVIALWLLIFGKNVFSNLLFVDYTPANAGTLWRDLTVNNFTNSINVLGLLNEMFGIAGISSIFFSFAILISMLVSYFYISRLIDGKKRILFGLIFFFNPFVYTRLMIGQLGIIAAYLLLPVFLFYLFGMFEKNLEYRSVLKVVLAMTLIGAITPHFFILCFILFLVGSFWFYFYKNNFNVLKYIKVFGIFVLILLLLNLYWMQGMFAGGILGEINAEHEEFFSPKMSSGISAIAKVVGMWGFWRENAFDRTYTIMPVFLWYFIISFLVLLMLVGYYSDNENKKSKFFYTLFWLGLILGVGISHPYTGKIFNVLFENIPFFNGFRDSHKFAAFIALAYAYLLPNAVLSVNKSLTKKWMKIISVIGLIVLVFGLNFTMINLHGQVKNVEYPSSYSEVNEFFNNIEIGGKIIYLPWQGYLSYSWTKDVSSDGRIGAFANGIVEKGVVTGPDEFGGNNGFRMEVSKCLEEKNKDCLKKIGVGHIMHDKCAYYSENYSWLGDEEIFSNECVDVYSVGGISEEMKVPFRFILSLIVSVLTLVGIIFALENKRLRRKQREQQKHKPKTI